MSKNENRRATAAPGRKLIKININPDKAWFTRRAVRATSALHPEVLAVIRGRNPKESFAEFARATSDLAGEQFFRRFGGLRFARRESKRLGISLGHYWFAATGHSKN